MRFSRWAILGLATLGGACNSILGMGDAYQFGGETAVGGMLGMGGGVTSGGAGTNPAMGGSPGGPVTGAGGSQATGGTSVSGGAANLGGMANIGGEPMTGSGGASVLGVGGAALGAGGAVSTGGVASTGGSDGAVAGGSGGAFPDPPNTDQFQYMSTGDRGCSSANGCAGNCAINLAKVGEAYREFWENPTGAGNSNQIPSLTSCQYSAFPDNATYPGVPILGGLRGHSLTNSTKFNDIGDNYGERVRGFIKAPATGNYTFWLDSDQAGQLYISTLILLGGTASLPSKATGVAFVNDYTPQGTFNLAGQKSQAVVMVQDNYYYFDFFHRASGGTTDHWEIRWTKPGQSMTFETVPASVIYSVTPTPGSGPACL